MISFLEDTTINQINTIGAWLVCIGFVLFSIAAPITFFIKEDTAKNFPNQEFHFIIWPAIAAQTFFSAIWGKVGNGIFGVLTFKSVRNTLFFSVTINILCIFLILNKASQDSPSFSVDHIRILYTSKIWFICCNFLGDLLSIHVTRYLLDKIIHSKIKSWKYIILDITGILCGYLIMLLPSFLVYQISITFYETPNELLQTGLLGNLLIPFFLLIFAFTDFPSIVTFFALFSILSITIPTGIYLFLIIFVNIGYRLYKRYSIEKNKMVRRYSKTTKEIGAYLTMLGSVLLALPFLIKNFL